MATFKTQCYNREMTTLVWEKNEEFLNFDVAVMEALGNVSPNSIIVLWVQCLDNPNMYKLIAKFY